MDPWEKFQALKAADKLTMMNGKLRESTRWADQVYLDPWEKFQALRAADKLTATRRPRTRGTDQLKSDIHRPRERKDVRITSTPSESLTTAFVCSRRPVGTPDHVTSLGYTGVYQPRTMQTENRGLSTLYYSGNFARETGLHTLQQQRLRVLQPLNGSGGPFSEVEDWFASKCMRAPKQELYKSSAKQRTSTLDILGVYPSSYGAQDFTDSSSTGTDTESIDVESTDDASSDVSEISYRFNSSNLDELSENSDGTVPNWYKAVKIGLRPVEPKKSTTVHQLYSLTLPISGAYKGKSQSTNVTVSHILAPKQDNPCVQKCTDDLTVYTDTVTDKSLVSTEQQQTSTEGDVNVHPSSPEVQNNIDDLFTLTEPMPARAMDDTSSYVPKLIYPLDSSGLDELSDDCDSIITETVDIPKSETKESSTIDKTSNKEDFNKSEKREGTSKYEHLVDSDNPDIINSFTFKDDVKPTEQESLESNVSPSIPQAGDTLREIPAFVSDTLIIEKKITEQVISMPETPQAQGDTLGRDISTQTDQVPLEQKQVREEVGSHVVPRELTRSSDDAAFPETSSEGRTSYSRHILSQGERGQDRETESLQASGERSTVCEITEQRCSEINGQSNRPTDRSNLEILNKVKQNIKDTGSNINLEKIQTTNKQEVTDKENKNRQEKEECKNRDILQTEEALRQEDTEPVYENIKKYLEEFKKKLEEQYVESRPDSSFVRGGDINVTVQCGVLNTKHIPPTTGNQPVSAENATSAYKKDGHENDPKGVCPQTGPWVDKRSTRQTRHIKKCRNCGSTRLDTVSESSVLISGTSISQRSPRFLIDSMQGDPHAYCKERGRERVSMHAEQAIVHDKARASNTTRIGGQRELQQRKSRSQKLRDGEVDPCAADPGKNRSSRKAIKEGVLSPPITSQSPLSPPTETKETDAKPEREKRKRNVLKRKKSEDMYKVGSENEPGPAQSQKKTIKPSHSKTVKPKDDFTDIFVTETAEYQCPSSDEANETSSRPKDSTIVEASSLISTGSINSDTNDIIGRKNVNATEIKPEASPKAHRDKSSSTFRESGDSTDNGHKSKRKRTGKSGTRLKCSTEPTKTTEASPKAHRDKSSSTSSESDDSTDSDSIPKRKRTGKSGSRLKRSTEQTKTRKTEASPKTHKDRSSSTSSESDDSTNRIKTLEVKKRKETGNRKDVKSKRKSKHLPPVTSTSTVQSTDQSISDQEVKQTTQDSEPSSISSNSTKDSESTDGDTVYSETEDNDDDEKEDDKQKKFDKINKKEKRKNEIAELKKTLEEVKKIDKSEKRSQENQKKEQKTMEKLDKELEKKRKEIEKVNLKREQRQIKQEKDEKNALKEEKKLQKIQMKREKEMSTIKKKTKKDENEEKKLEKLRIEIKKVEDKQALKNQEIEQTQTDEYDNVVDGDDNYDDGCHIVNANNDDFDDIVEGDDEDKQPKSDTINLKEKRKKEIAELKKKLEEVKKIDKSEKRSQENQKKEQKTMGKLDKELEKKRKEIEKVNLKREQRQIKKEKDEKKNALKEDKKLQKMQIKQEKEEQSKIKKESKKAENEEKKLEKLRNEIKKVEDKQASKKIEQNHTDENDDDDDDGDDDDDDRGYAGDHIVNDTLSDSDDFVEGDDEDENTQTERSEMDGKVDVKNKIAELKEKLEEGKIFEKAEKRIRESQKKDEQAKKKLDKKQEREKSKLEEVARKKELQRIKDERNKTVKLLQEKKKFLEKQIKQKKKEQAKIQKEAKKAAKDAEKERKKSKKTQKDAKKKEQKKALKKEEKHRNANDDKDDLEPKVNECDSDQNDDEGNNDENKQTKSQKMNEHADVIQNEIAELKEELEEVIMTEETQNRQIKSDEKNEQAIEKLDKEMEREKKKMEEIDRKLEFKQKKIEKDEEKKMLKEEKKIFEKLMKEEKREQSRITKEAKKAEKEKEKGRKKAEKEVEKERKKAEQEKEKQRKKVEKEQKDAQKKEEKEAKKAAEKEQKESAKVVKKREKEQKGKEKREKMRKKKEQQKETKLEKEKQKEESKLLAFRRKKEMERQSRMKKAEEQKEKEEMNRKAAEKETVQKEEINKIKKERKKEKERWKVIEKRDKITLKHEKEDRKIEQKQREHEQVLLKIRNGLKHDNQSLAEDSQDEITKDESSPDTSSSDSEQEITKKESSPVKPSSVIPAEDCENEYMEIFQNCASNESDSPCDRFAPESLGHLTVRDHEDIYDNAVRSRPYQMKEKKINLVLEFQKYLARKARSQESEEASNSVSNQAPSGNSKTNERGLSLPSCTESQHIIEAEEISDVHQNRQTSQQLEEQTLSSQEKDKTKHPYHSLNEDVSKSALNTSRNPGVDQPARNKDRGKGAYTGSSENPRNPEIVQRHATRDKSDKKAAGAKSRDNPSLSESTQKVTRTPEAVRSIIHGKKVYDSMNKTRTAMDDQTGSGYHSWDDSDEEIEIEKKTSVINLDQRRGIEVDFVPDGGHNSWDDSDEETEVEKKPSIMKLDEMRGIDVEFVPEYSYNSWDDTDDEDTIEHEIKYVMGENLDIYEPKPTPPVEEKEPDILADPILKELYGDEYEDVCGVKDKK